MVRAFIMRSHAFDRAAAIVRRHRRARARLRDERGTSLIEVCVAIMVMATAVTGVIGTIAGGFSLVGQARQRSSGTEVAQRIIEQAHNVPYANVALNGTNPPAGNALPAHSTDPANPDYNVSTDGTQYDQDGSGPQPSEPLIIDTTNGALPHIEDPVTVGLTQFNIYQYVTWVDDPTICPGTDPCDHIRTQDYKRVVVVVTWKFPVHSGTSHSVTQQTFVSDGTVSVPTPTPVPTATPTPISTPTPAPTPTPTPGATPTPTPAATPTPTPGPCTGDTAPPSAIGLTLLSGTGAQQGYTNSTNVQAQVVATDGCAPINAYLSNDGSSWTQMQTPLTSGVTSTVSWTVPNNDGTKTVYAYFKDGNGNQSGTLSRTLILDKTIPSAPANLRKASLSCSGNNRTVTLTWDASTDTTSAAPNGNLQGYRLYKSIEQGPFTFVSSSSSLSASNTDLKTYNSLRYRVTAYDKAGNESSASNIFSLSKNVCS